MGVVNLTGAGGSLVIDTRVIAAVLGNELAEELIGACSTGGCTPEKEGYWLTVSDPTYGNLGFVVTPNDGTPATREQLDIFLRNEAGIQNVLRRVEAIRQLFDLGSESGESIDLDQPMPSLDDYEEYDEPE